MSVRTAETGGVGVGVGERSVWAVGAGLGRYAVLQGDALAIPLPDKSVDLVVTSPPYEAKRRYSELGFRLRGEAWVAWCVACIEESLRVCRGLVVFNIDGGARKGRPYEYSCVPELVIAELYRRGHHLRRPCYYVRAGVPGSGGPDWFAGRVETLVCVTAEPRRLPWSDNKACGHPPKWKAGGEPSHRMPNGRRVSRLHTKRGAGQMLRQGYTPPDLCNPGNVIECAVGGGRMGHKLAHENEAPFALKLPERFIRSCCPPGGIVLDPFCGSGTTLHAALLHGRRGIGIDARASQVDLTRRRLEDVAAKLEGRT